MGLRRTARFGPTPASTGAADALVFRTTWDYFDRWEAFQGWLHDVEKVTTLINPAACLHWNLDKHYLLDLEQAGIPWCPASSTAATGLSWDEASQGSSDDLVIKPTVSVQPRTPTGDATPKRWHLAPAHPAPRRPLDLVAPTPGHDGAAFLPSVVADGELSLMWLGAP